MKYSRQALTDIIEDEGGVNWWKPELFSKNVQSLLPTELEIISPPPQKEENYNCFVFSFGLENDSDFLGGNNPVQAEYVRHLLLQKILTRTDKQTEGDLVFYENIDHHITHGGIMQSDETVLSKWMWGPTIHHNLMDVPQSFGDSVFYTNRPTTKEIKEEYEKYRDSGVEIKPIS